MVHVRLGRVVAKVDHGLFFASVSCTPAHQQLPPASPQNPGRSEFFPGPKERVFGGKLLQERFPFVLIQGHGWNSPRKVDRGLTVILPVRTPPGRRTPASN